MEPITCACVVCGVVVPVVKVAATYTVVVAVPAVLTGLSSGIGQALMNLFGN